MTRLGGSSNQPGTRDLYERLYQRVYRRMYRRLRPLYEEIRGATAYPPRA